jgi:RibD C-terminal domain
MPLVFAIVPRRCRRVLVVSYALSNAILELRCGLSWGALIVHQLLDLLYCCGARTRAALTVRDVRHRRLETDREVRGFPLIRCVPAFWRYAKLVTAQGVVWIDVAGPDLAGRLTNLGLIDEYLLYLRPIVLGRGTPFFAGPRPPLRLVASDLVGEGVIRLTYVAA